LLIDPVRWCKLPEFNGVILRRETTDLKKPGAIVSESRKIYPHLGGVFGKQEMTWRFGEHNMLSFAGLQYEDDKLSWQGAQLDFIGFDELTHFTESQFWYLCGRARSTSGLVNPYVRATTNPEANWVLDLIEWWIDKDGWPILDRAGKLRWFIRLNDVMQWFDSKQEAENFRVQNSLPEELQPKSLTFIPATVEDNQILMTRNPEYVATLHALPELEKQKLLHGNWRVKATGKLFKSDWFQRFAINPRKPDLRIVVVDTAQETKSANDYTAIGVMSRFDNKMYIEKMILGS
jgi:hypothetical protein